MKTKTYPIKHPSIALLAVAVGSLAVNSFGQSGTWTNDLSSVWSDSTNWLNGVVANGAGNTATFETEFGSTVEVDLDSPRTIGNLTFGLGVFTITNNAVDANTLTMAGPAKPVIDTGGGTATIRATVLAGTDGFTLEGGGILNLFKENTNAANTISGDIVLNNGTLQVQGINEGAVNSANTLAVGSVSSFTFINGTLNLRPAPNTTPDYGVVNANLIVPQDSFGTLILPVRWSGSSGDNAATPGQGLGGSLTGSGTLNVETKYVRGNVVGDWSAFSGQINITANTTPNATDEFRFGSILGLPLAAVNLGGLNAFTFRYYPAITSTTNFPIGSLSGDNSQVFMAGSSSAAFTLIYDVGARHTDPTDVSLFAGNIVNGSGPAGLLKRGAGTLILTGENSYTGPTTISNGLVQIGDGFSDMGSIGSGPITNHTGLVFARGNGTLTVTAPIAGAGPITNSGMSGTLILLGTNTYTAPTVVTAGKLIVGTASRVTSPYTLIDFAEGFGVQRHAAGASLSIGGLSYSGPGTFEARFGNFPNPTGALVTNTGTLAMNGDITVNVDGDGITVGSITLLQYAARTGSGNFVLGTLPPHVTGASITHDTANNRVILNVTETFDDTLRWVGNPGAVWDVDNPANNVWVVVGSGQVTNYYDGAKVLFDDSSSANVVDVAAVVSPAAITVNNTTKAYTFGGGGFITGSATLTKDGTNSLTLLTANDYTGQTRIEAGTLQLGDGMLDGAIGSGVVTNFGTLVLNRATGPFTMANAIHGTGGVVVTGPGQVNLSGANTYTGGLTVMPGAIYGNASGNAAGIGGGITVNSATVVLVADVFNNVGDTIVLTNAVFQNTGGNRVIDVAIRGTNVAVTFNKTALITVNRDMSGISGVITNLGTGLLRFNSGGGNNNTGSANALWVLETEGGFVQPRNATVNHLGALSGVGTLSSVQSGNGSVTWSVGALNTSTTFGGVIADDPALNRWTGLTKVGTGTLTLDNATLTYRLSTVVSNGTLALVGTSLPALSTNFLVASPGILNVTGLAGGTLPLGDGTTNQWLQGNGTVQGNVVLGALGHVAPGVAPGATGNLTVSGSITLNGSHLFEVTTTGTPASDRLTAASITYGGTLVITNVGSITGTNTFQLFSGTLAGTFTSVVTPSIPDVTWDTSNLNVNGTITVTGPPGVDTTPTNIVTSVSGGVMTLTWPESHIGWRLQSQTNSLNVGLSNNWVDVPNSAATNRVDLPIGLDNGAVFFRLVYP